MGIKKTCVGCYAAYCGAHPMMAKQGKAIKGCNLGYENYKGVPLEECPKPKSWKALDRAPRKEK